MRIVDLHEAPAAARSQYLTDVSEGDETEFAGTEAYFYLRKKIKNGGDIDTRTISKLCKLLDCQPGDILEYVPDEDEN